ncbi:MAG: tetraacyldisaccharide 4'-kinase [Bacteroides sp.]|nr:tetraacyldisaccharide 4'-kinase [Bacteroides sp.]
MRHNKILDILLLKPLSMIYGAVIYVRNQLFEWGILKQHSFDIPVLAIGNLSVGGTGKTPHTEYIVDALKNEYHIGVLSRGYRRKTKGFVLASKRSTPWDIGDEPFQIFQKFGNDVRVAVCEKRVKGIKELLRIDPQIDLIVLDDAFQHRYVKPSTSIVLMEWNRPIYNDELLPLGRLREPQRAILRADMVIVTKCPAEVRPVDVRLIYDHLGLFAYQKVFFSRYAYGNLVSVFPDEVRYMPNLTWMTPDDSVLVVTGIANPSPLVRYLKAHKVKVEELRFPDHHQFTRRDFEDITGRFNKMKGRNKYIVTTEKDSVRIAGSPYYPHDLKASTFYLPIKVEILPHKMPLDSDSFDRELRKLLKRPLNGK